MVFPVAYLKDYPVAIAVYYVRGCASHSVFECCGIGILRMIVVNQKNGIGEFVGIYFRDKIAG